MHRFTMRNGRNSGKATKSRVEASSGNVFADLGLANPDLALTKAELVQLIRSIIAKRELTQAQAAKILGLDQPKVSALIRGRVDGYSLDRLFRFLGAFDRHIEIRVRSNPKAKSAPGRSITVTY